MYLYMYFHICPHKHTHTISFFYTHNKEIFKITFLKLKVQNCSKHSVCSAFPFQQAQVEVTLCVCVWGGRGRGRGGGAVTLCVADRGECRVCCFLWTAWEKIKRSVCLLVLFKHICTQTHTYTSILSKIFQTPENFKGTWLTALHN